MVQIGFESGLKAAEFKRPPLNLIAVVVKSGSMGGQPLALVKDSLIEILDNLQPEDQLSIVLYGNYASVFIEPMKASVNNKERIFRNIS